MSLVDVRLSGHRVCPFASLSALCRLVLQQLADTYHAAFLDARRGNGLTQQRQRVAMITHCSVFKKEVSLFCKRRNQLTLGKHPVLRECVILFLTLLARTHTRRGQTGSRAVGSMSIPVLQGWGNSWQGTGQSLSGEAAPPD